MIAAPLYVSCKNPHTQSKFWLIALQRTSNCSAFVLLINSAGKNDQILPVFGVLAVFYKFHWTSKLYAALIMGNRFLGVHIQLFGLYLLSKQSHYCGKQKKLRTLQESFTPVQSFAAETYFILIMITKGPQLVLKTNILYS